MNENYIVACADDFIKKLEDMKITTSKIEDIENKRNEVIGENGKLKNFVKDCNSLKALYEPKGDKLNNVEKQLKNVLEIINDNICKWNKQVEKDAKGIKFVKKHEKYFMVMIFGPVKAGKSTLGNFFAGDTYRKAKFESKFKQYQKPSIEIEELARVVNQQNNNESFGVGILDTTGNMQYFTLLGLRWMDTPGLGALGKDSDKRNMDEMVNEYISYADMCIFLTNSSEPGLAKELEYMEKITRDEQESLILITKSDTICRDSKSDKYKQKISKEDTERKQQENYVLTTLKKDYPNININKCKVISISTEIAKKAIEENDTEMFKSSNIDKLMKALEDVCENAALRKMKRPKQSFNNFINMIIEGEYVGKNKENNESIFKGIDGLKSELDKISKFAQEYKNKISEKENSILMMAQKKIEGEINSELRKLSDSVRKNNEVVEQNEILKIVNNIINKNLDYEINNALKNIIDNYRNQQINIKNVNFETGSLENKKDIVTTKYTVIESEVRAPDGIWENVRSFFGKVYYRRVSRERQYNREIVLGTNIDEITNKVIEGTKKESEKIIHEELSKFQQNYFAPQEAYVKEMNKLLNNFKQDLLSMKF